MGRLDQNKDTTKIQNVNHSIGISKSQKKHQNDVLT